MATQRSAKSIKEERAAQRAEKVEAFKAQRAREKRNRRLGIAGAIVGVVAVLSLIAGAIYVNYTPPVDPDSITVEGIEEFPGVPANHVAEAVDYEAEYEMSPPAGGNHAAAWLNCGIYDQPQQNENAVHALEHGAVWVTYDPDEVSGSDLETLRNAVPSTYMIVSPYPGLDAPVVASAWGVQVKLDGVDDERLDQFITKYWKSANAPEPGAACTGQITGPGLVG